MKKQSMETQILPYQTDDGRQFFNRIFAAEGM